MLQAIVALRAFTAGLQQLDKKIDGTIDGLRFDMNKPFDDGYGDLEEIKTRVTRLGSHPA